jgi:outer membrane protein assembly factor BamD
MKNIWSTNRFLLMTLACCLLLLQTGCGGLGKLAAPFKPSGKQPETAENLAQKGLNSFNHGKYESALDTFKKLKDRYPFSQYSLLAELKIADSQYYLENYEEALQLYKTFEENHPSNEAVPYVMFQIGMCYYQQIDTIDRDTSGATKAIEAFSRLLKSYPVSPYSEESRARITAARNFLADHEYYVAVFYVKTKSYSEAEARLEYLLATYPDADIAARAHRLLADLRKGNPPRRTLKSWLPSLFRPDWQIFGSSGDAAD